MWSQLPGNSQGLCTQTWTVILQQEFRQPVIFLRVSYSFWLFVVSWDGHGQSVLCFSSITQSKIIAFKPRLKRFLFTHLYRVLMLREKKILIGKENIHIYLVHAIFGYVSFISMNKIEMTTVHFGRYKTIFLIIIV